MHSHFSQDRRTFLLSTSAGALASLLRAAPAAGTDLAIIPTPHELHWQPGDLDVRDARLTHDDSATAKVAAGLLGGAGISSGKPGQARIVLHDAGSRQTLPPELAALLDSGDHRLLSAGSHGGQAYVVRVDAAKGLVLLAGSGPSGVLYAAATLAQMIRAQGQRLLVRGAHVRDYPDFPFRAAADWLLFAEINRWGYDWGDGVQAFRARIRRKLDFCLQHKINMVLFDGFGWHSEKFPGYGLLMREMAHYARERGIKLLFAGYGAGAAPSTVRPDHNIGTVWLNREHYPNGAIYDCIGEKREPGRQQGTCRANEDLNRLKAEEMRRFVRSVEPGALYIHHEDYGVGEQSPLLETWLERCPRCRARWPNDDYLAADGGAGAIAHGFANTLQAIRGVRNSDSGYDSSRDCEVVFISPGYAPDSAEPKDWERVFRFWTNILKALPDDANVSIGFRETFPENGTDRRFIDAYQAHMRGQHLNSRTFLFLLGGADLYINNYPLAASPALNGMFRGAETMYNFSGGVHQEPQQLLNAEFSWNATAPGFRAPVSHADALSTWKALSAFEQVPEEIGGPDGFLVHACRKIYGPRAGDAMWRFFNLYEPQPVIDGRTLVPRNLSGTGKMYFPDRIYPLSVLGGTLLVFDGESWDVPITKPGVTTILKSLDMDEATWQQRLGQGWALYASVTRRGQTLAQTAYDASDLNPGAKPDVEYLLRCLGAGERIADLLSAFHATLAEASPERKAALPAKLKESRDRLDRLTSYLRDNFTFDRVGPLGGDQAIWLETVESIRVRLEELSLS